MLVEGKHLYREAVDKKKGWDKQVCEELSRKWNKWVKSLQTVKVPRSIAPYLEDVIQVSLNHFMDASDKAVSAQTVAVVTQSSGVTQGLLTSKSRITKRGLTTPGQELVGCQMGANLAVNTIIAGLTAQLHFAGLRIRSKIGRLLSQIESGKSVTLLKS